MLRRKLRFEPLEDRHLLAVTVNFNAGTGLLSISSDSASDTVSIDGLGSMGDVLVAANGSGAVHIGVNKISVNMGGGNDGLHLSALAIGGSITVNMGSGADLVDVDTVPDSSFATAGNVFVGGSMSLTMGENAGDLVRFDQLSFSSAFSVYIGGNLKIAQVADVDLDGDGGSQNTEPADVNVGGNFTVLLNAFGDVNGDTFTVDIDDLNVGGLTTITGSAAADRVRIDDSTFARNVTVSLGGGNDIFNLNSGSNRFRAHLSYLGGSGTDTFDNVVGNFFAFPPTLTSVENLI